MKGLVVEKNGIVRIANDIPEPKIGSYDALVETIACGICNGTDLKIIDGHFKGFNTYPCVLGHEPVGKVIEVGEKVTTYKKGDHVLRSMLTDTPEYYSGWGSFAEYGTVSDYAAMVNNGVPNVFTGHMAQQIVPPEFDPNLAVMLITFKEVLSGLKRFGVSEGMKIMINGCGPVGLSMVRLSKILGVSKLIVSDTDDTRLQTAGRLGADVLVNPMKDDVEAIVKSKVGDGLDIFIDAVGRNELINLGLKLVKFNGKVAVYGIAPKLSAEIDWEHAPYNWDIHFVQWPTFDEEAAVHDRIVEYVKCGALKLEDFTTHVLPLEDFNKGLDLVKARKGLKISLTLK
ncbi:MAG: hypothetical protein A2Y21_00290 [Clostridiales bacterium GWC2_40_7]|nr:MAG: hypothetical protein A2Y21_00290 [Clostridiales bacterium GWC2_40_7]